MINAYDSFSLGHMLMSVVNRALVPVMGNCNFPVCKDILQATDWERLAYACEVQVCTHFWPYILDSLAKILFFLVVN